MEEKKNNAVEKVENAIVNKGGQDKKKNKVKNSKAKTIKQKKQDKRNAKKEKRERERAEREKIRAEKRVELARIKAHKKAEKEKAKATALREKNRRKAELKAKKEQLKAERQARKEARKSQTKKQKLANKRAEKEQRAKDRQKNKQRNKGVGGWLAAVISLGVATLVLASALTFTFLMPTKTDVMLESTYRKSFYDVVEQVDNIDLNLSKALASLDKGAMQVYLVDTAINSELAENDIQQLPLQDESKFYTTKLINQIGDFAKYLNKKIIQGENLSKQDYEGLNQLYLANRTLKESLSNTVKGMGNDYNLLTLLSGGEGNLIIDNFNQLQNLSVKYPELIYDGPFSDGLTEREVKGLSGEDITDADAKQIFTKIFAEYSLENVKNVGVTSGKMETFNVQGEIDGEILFAQISKKGGKLIAFSYAGSCKSVKIKEDSAIDNAEAFLDKLSISQMKPVWINLSNNLYTINFASTSNGVIIYPDLIKVRVCAQTGKVIGIEATTYYVNHTEREIGSPVLSSEQAQEKVNENIEIDSTRLAVVPVGAKTEKLCYEISGVFNDSMYYVYIDAVTGRQVEMFKVIQSTEGALLM